MHNSQYRPDIDGLRTLAVISVVVFHFNNEWLPGGFIGVDIFFVISGFLITGIVYRQVEQGGFSFKEFFVRRVRRIVPAAMFVTLVTLLVGMVFMLPADSKALSESAIASVFSLANVYFWLFLDAGYFAASTDTVPLLHMWSLGVEEQFYLIWPVILLLSYKLGGMRLLFWVSVALAASSFLLSEFYVSKDPAFAYYMLPTRAGGLLIGCMTFMLTYKYATFSNKAVSEIFSVVGLGLIVWSFFSIDKASFPGFISLIPSIGGALLIASGSVGNSSVGRLLSFRPFVIIGLLSFSLYLWHWPILAFYRYAYGEPTFIGGMLCLFLIVGFTVFSYRYIETPFRKPSVRRVKFSVGAAVLVAVVISFSGLVYSSNGYVNKGYAERVSSMEELTKAAYSFRYVCQSSNHERLESLLNHDRCIIGPSDQAPSVLIWGDSNAAHYVGYLKAVAEHSRVSMRNLSHPACVPFFDNSSDFVTRDHESCDKFNQVIKSELGKYDTVIVGASWTAYFSRSDEFENEFRNTIDYLSKGVGNVLVAKKIPIFHEYDRQCAQKAITIPLMNCFERSRIDDEGDHRVNDLIEEIVSEYSNVATFTIRDKICDGVSCYAYLNSVPVYYNSGHLSLLGSEALGEKAVKEGSISNVFTFLRKAQE
ncbi:MAG: acyltransferase [Halomonas sp.]|nr:acyltransferase family protein [Halomonas sp.]MCC5882483.1 acyltransferase [Halomonas sp.]